jgi:3-dehydroquinate dehydratase-2
MWVLNGPNLARLGRREVSVYGIGSYADLVGTCERAGDACGVSVHVRQTDAEHELIRWLHDAADEKLPVVLNAGAWTHTSIAIRDAAAELRAPWVEVHLSNVHARESFRRHSYLSELASGVIVGLGPAGYEAAIRFLAQGSAPAALSPRD